MAGDGLPLRVTVRGGVYLIIVIRWDWGVDRSPDAAGGGAGGVRAGAGAVSGEFPQIGAACSCFVSLSSDDSDPTAGRISLRISAVISQFRDITGNITSDDLRSSVSVKVL
jgi:hypothetical protein